MFPVEKCQEENNAKLWLVGCVGGNCHYLLISFYGIVTEFTVGSLLIVSLKLKYPFT